MICYYWGYSAESFDATLAAASCQLCSQPLVFKPTATHLICHAAATQQWPSKTHLFALTGALGVTLCHFISLSHQQPFFSNLCQNRLPPQTLLFVPRTTTLTARRCQLDTLALHWTPVYHLCTPSPSPTSKSQPLLQLIILRGCTWWEERVRQQSAYILTHLYLN